MVQKAKAWSALSERHGVSLPATAIAFAGMPKCVSKVVLGMATVDELDQNLDYIDESSRKSPQLGLTPSASY
jgi:aryl-alcohol dehydrogenase-like predicted oxidoreductase